MSSADAERLLPRRDETRARLVLRGDDDLRLDERVREGDLPRLRDEDVPELEEPLELLREAWRRGLPPAIAAKTKCELQRI